MTRERGLDGTEVLAALAGRDTFFGLDIGTKADDLFLRKQAIDRAASLLCGELKKKAEKMIHYSEGIWPDVESSSFMRSLIRVVLPDPLFPTTKTNSPLSICKFAWFTAGRPGP